MNYRLKFLPSALKEWRGLDKSIQAQPKKKLAERLEMPHVPSSKIRGYDLVYKIKLSNRPKIIFRFQPPGGGRQNPVRHNGSDHLAEVISGQLLRASGNRLVYEVNDEEITVLVIAVGKRDRSGVSRRWKVDWSNAGC